MTDETASSPALGESDIARIDLEVAQPAAPAQPGRASGQRIVLRMAVVILVMALVATFGAVALTRSGPPGHSAAAPGVRPTKGSDKPKTVAVEKPAPPTNQQIAARYAAYLMSLTRLPAGSSSLGTKPPAGTPSQLDSVSALLESPYQEGQTRYAVVAEPPQTAIAWMKGHPPAGGVATESGELSGPEQPTVYDEGFVWPSTSALDQPDLLVATVAYGNGESVVRVDSQVVYHPNRPSAEAVPAGVVRIVVTITTGSKQQSYTVANAARIAQFVQVVDSLRRPVITSNPGGPCLCGPATTQTWTAYLYLPHAKSPAVTVSDLPFFEGMGTGNIDLLRGKSLQPVLQEQDYDLTRVVAAATGFHFIVLGS